MKKVNAVCGDCIHSGPGCNWACQKLAAHHKDDYALEVEKIISKREEAEQRCDEIVKKQLAKEKTIDDALRAAYLRRKERCEKRQRELELMARLEEGEKIAGMASEAERRRAYQHLYYIKRREHLIEKNRRYYHEHKEQQIAYAKAYNIEHHEELRQLRREKYLLEKQARQAKDYLEDDYVEEAVV